MTELLHHALIVDLRVPLQLLALEPRDLGADLGLLEEPTRGVAGGPSRVAARMAGAGRVQVSQVFNDEPRCFAVGGRSPLILNRGNSQASSTRVSGTRVLPGWRSASRRGRLTNAMPKRPLKLKVRIPEYAPPRNTWRQAIHKAVTEVQEKEGVSYERDDRLEVKLRLYFTSDRATEIHDVDNRLKDCLDALQGRVGGTKTKTKKALPPIVPNDRQIWRVVVEKGAAPKQSAHGRGHLVVRRLGKG
jgi:hypothetical protein